MNEGEKQGSSRLPSLPLIRCVDPDERERWRRPNPLLISNIVMMWQFLALTVRDWKVTSAPYQAQIDSRPVGQAFAAFSVAFHELQPYCLKCLFSYVMFFVSLEGVYQRLYEELNRLSRYLRVKHCKAPTHDDYIAKVKKIRDCSIVHQPSTRATQLDATAAMLWQPMSMLRDVDERWNLDRMAFSSGTLRDANGRVASDFEIGGILELDECCRQHLRRWDDVCADYLQSMLDRLPLMIKGKRWEAHRF